MEPLISGIRWVEELIEIAGGEMIFPDLRYQHDARQRIVQARKVTAAGPDVIIASWCGRKVDKDIIRGRPGWGDGTRCEERHIYEVKSTYILQPGPAALTEGVLQLHAILARVAVWICPATSVPPSAATGTFRRNRRKRSLRT
jgi:iron complex transport system substrate-binding protein